VTVVAVARTGGLRDRTRCEEATMEYLVWTTRRIRPATVADVERA